MTTTTIRRLLLGAASAALLLCACGGGESTTDPRSLPPVSMSPAGSTQPANATLDAYIQAKLVEGKIPGASVAVMENGRLLYAKSYGYADLESRTPMTPRAQSTS